MRSLLLALFVALTVVACKTKPSTKVVDTPKPKVENVLDWSSQAVIYEVNIRQYTPEGTFKAFEKHLPRLKELGVDILWIMPIHPIGKKNRKGELGSFYASRNYKAIHPDYGTEADLHELINAAHSMGFKVILDWVANHSAFDNVWAIEHPDWYTKDSLGQITHPKGTDWTDVADFNYDNPDMRAAMIDAMEYWVRKFNIDGYRCDVAGFVPYDFWKDAIDSLNKIKPVFMLAEWEDDKIHASGFHATYGWEMHHIMNQIAQGKMKPQAIDTFIHKDMKRFPKGAYRMNFTTNHDENSWNGTIKERMGDAGDVMTVMAFTMEGMPLIYSGQEAGLDKRLSFFGKDEIDWSDLSKQVFFKKLTKLKHHNPALQNGIDLDNYRTIATTNPNIIAYERKNGDAKVVALLNLSKTPQSFELKDYPLEGKFWDVFADREVELKSGEKFELGAWGYRVFSNR
ncbi:MAG TPA: alpha-amylase [Saprospiraceae bacterium]|nr:alpha-amylase [Saprospiraceae bacterium]